MVTATDPGTMSRWLDLLSMEADGHGAWLARHCDGGPARTFGGQLLAQGLYAAGLDVENDRIAAGLAHATLRPAAVHAAFLRPGDGQRPLVLRVVERRDGRASAYRSVMVGQGERTVCRVDVSFTPLGSSTTSGAAPEATYPPDGPGADAGVPLSLAGLPQPVELRRSARHTWVRVGAGAPADPLVQACLLAWASDLTAFDEASRAARAEWGWTDGLVRISLDHHVWFHAAPDLTAWLQLEQSCVPGEGGSTLTQGHYLDPSGRRVASLAQEGLVRPRRQP
jgi:acyl-CoA thioesterase II